MAVSLLPLVLLLGQGATPPPPRVAVLYSAWGEATFREEFDSHLAALGWPMERFENTEIDALVPRLGEFDLVVATAVANLENPRDLTAHRAEWLAWLEAGGGLLVTDASYDTVLGQWLGGLGEGSALSSAGCAPFTHAHGGSAAIACDESSALTTTPVRLRPVLEAKGGIWAHLESWGPAWRSLVTCADGKSLLVARDVGKGCALATSYFRFQGESARPAATGLLRNLWAHVQALRSGVELTALDLGPEAPGPRTARVALRSTTGGPVTGHLTLRVAYGAEPAVFVDEREIVAQPGRATEETVPLTLDRRGPVRVLLELTVEGRAALSLEQAMEIPEAVALTLADTHLYPQRRELALRARYCPATTDGAVESALLLDGREVVRQAPPAEGRTVLPVEGLAEGPHVVRAELRGREGLLDAVEAPFTLHGAPTVGVRRDGTLVRGGRPWFPFGWYHVSWGYTAEERLDCLREIAAAGFNAIHAGVREVDEWQDFLDEADRLGVGVITEFGADPAAVIERYRDHPAVLAWNPGDEPDGQGITPEEMTARAHRFKDLDPMHPTYMTACVPSAYARYAGVADILAPDPYPITREGAATLPVYDNLTAAAREAAHNGRTVIAVLQCFGYETLGPWRVPTFAECRAMTYLALLAGAKGIIYYTYADGNFEMASDAALWASMAALPAEIELLQPALTEGARTVLETGSAEVVAAAWALPDRTVVIVANASMAEARDVRVALPAESGTQLAPVLPEGAGDLALADGALTGRLAPLEVRAIEVR